MWLTQKISNGTPPYTPTRAPTPRSTKSNFVGIACFDFAKTLHVHRHYKDVLVCRIWVVIIDALVVVSVGRIQPSITPSEFFFD